MMDGLRDFRAVRPDRPPGYRARQVLRRPDDRRSWGVDEDGRRPEGAARRSWRDDEARVPEGYRRERSRSPRDRWTAGPHRIDLYGFHFSGNRYFPSSSIEGRPPSPMGREFRPDDRRDRWLRESRVGEPQYSRESWSPIPDERRECRIEEQRPLDRRDSRRCSEFRERPPGKRRRGAADVMDDRESRDNTSPLREFPAYARDEAPLQAQIQWGKRLTHRDATVESILSLFSTDGRRFSARNLATAAHRVAKNGKRDRRVYCVATNVKAIHRVFLQRDPRMLALGEACARRVGDFKPVELANVVWAFATAGVEALRLFAEVADVAVTKLRDFKPQEISNTAWAFATAGVEAPRLFAEIVVVALSSASRLRDFNSQNIANTAWAFATAGVESPRLFAEIAVVAVSKLQDFKPQEIANVAWAFATAGVDAPQLFAEITNVAVSKKNDFNAQDIANTAWAFATAGVEARRLFAAIAEVAVSKLGDFNSQNITNTAWAFATSGIEAPGLFAEIAEVSVSKLEYFNSQDIANMVWAFATADVKAPRLFAEIAEVAVSKLCDFNSQSITNTAWGFAKAGVDAPGLFVEIADAALSKLRDFKPQEIANTAWAFATAGSEAPRLFSQIGEVAVSMMREFNSQNIANAAWAVAKAGVEASRFFDEVAVVAVAKLLDFNSGNIASTVWAFAKAGVEAPLLFAEIADVALSNVRDFTAQEIANTAWAFACLGSTKLDFLVALSTEAMAKQSKLVSFELSQLHLVDLHFRCTFPDQLSPLAPIRDRLQVEFQATQPNPSELQRDVAVSLNNLGWFHEFEYTTKEGLSLDMAQPYSKHAVEVDGPCHYLQGPTGTRPSENGPTRFKARLLHQLGWAVVKVPYYEWNRLGPREERNAYLRGKLEAAFRR